MAVTDSPATAQTQTDAAVRRLARLAKAAIGVAAAALLVSAVSIGMWAQASAQRAEVESRLACLELPGPNDCGQDAE